MTSPEKKRGYIPGLDGLRAISILMVVASHLGIRSLLPDTQFWQNRFAALCFGGIGVNCFFVISGFLITFLLLSEREKTGRIALPSFYLRRILRLAPALVLFILVNAVLMASRVIDPNWPGLMLGSVYLMNYSPLIFMSRTLSHLWSLGVEEQFYMLWPALLICFAPFGATLLAIGLILLSAFLVFHPFDMILDIQSAWVQHLTHLAHLDLGAIVEKYGRFFADGRYFHLASAFDLGRWTLPAIACILTGCVAALFERRYLRTRAISLPRFYIVGSIFYLSPLYVPLCLFSVSHMFQAIGTSLFTLAIFKSPASNVAQALEFAPLRYLGRISYGLYLWQGLFITSGTGSSVWFQKPPLNAILTLLVASVCFRFVEQPFLKLKGKLRREPQPEGIGG